MPFKNSYLKVFTGKGNAMYTIAANDLNDDIGFVRTDILPEEGDSVKYFLYNEEYRQIGEGDAVIIQTADLIPQGFRMRLKTSLTEAFLTS